MSTVSIVKVKDNIFEAVKQSIDLIGGIEKFVKPGSSVLIKPNMFQKDTIESGIPVHPEVVIAVAKLARSAGAKRVVVAERRDFILEMFEEYNEIYNYAEVLRFEDTQTEYRIIPGARVLRIQMPLSKLLDECDVFINVPGVRVHCLTKTSNGMKNLMGILPFETTRYIHMSGLTGSIVDLNRLVKSHLIISDGIYCVEGNFPGRGNNGKRTDVIFAGDNVVEVDSVVTKAIGYEPKEIQHLYEANLDGMGEIDINKINIVGEKLEDTKLNLKRAQVDATGLFENIKVINTGACSECLGAVSSGLNSLDATWDRVKPLDKKVTIVVGPNGASANAEGENVICVGNCTYNCRKRNTYVPGCSPLGAQVFAELKRIYGV